MSHNVEKNAINSFLIIIIQACMCLINYYIYHNTLCAGMNSADICCSLLLSKNMWNRVAWQNTTNLRMFSLSKEKDECMLTKLAAVPIQRNTYNIKTRQGIPNTKCNRTICKNVLSKQKRQWDENNTTITRRQHDVLF